MAEEALESTRSSDPSPWQFERALAECLAVLAAAPSSEADREITQALRRLCEILELDRAVVWQTTPEEPQTLHLTHLWAWVIPPVPEGITANVYYPWITRQVFAGREVVISDLEALPPEAATDVESLRYYDDSATAVFPLQTTDGVVTGAISFDDTTRHRGFSDEALVRCRLPVQAINGVLARKRADATTWRG
jgi:hypothetical protein